jgi:hypothetical protein
LPTLRATRLPQDNHRLGSSTFLRHPITKLLPTRVPRSRRLRPKSSPVFGRLAWKDSSWAFLRGYGNINPLSIDYASRPRLRPRLTQGGLAWPWNPWSFGGRGSHSSFATHACILTRAASTARSLCRFTRCTTLPYPPTHLDAGNKCRHRVKCECHSFGGVLEPRYIVGAEPLDQ